MNRNAIKKFAVWARSNLREAVETNAARFGVTREAITEPQFVAGGMVIGATAFDQPTTALYRALRDNLRERQRHKPLAAVVDELIDELAYTWFNRLAALRFMEIKGYIGRTLTSSVPGATEPDLLRDAHALAGSLPGMNLERIDALQDQGDETLYRALLAAQCRALASALPDLFGRAAYAELFLPTRLLTQGSFSQRLVSDVPEDDWQDIEIIGWLYQFYISERKDEVFAAKGAYDARDIPAATQLFTPHWIVRYMVENSLGRLWLEAHPESNLRAQMLYYLDSEGEKQQSVVEGTLKPKAELRPEDLSVLDPACGSGHILVYAFDLLFAIYQEQGYPESQIPVLILEHNLHGLDIDERAAQLTSFALMMKAREKSRRILLDPPELHITQTVPTRGWELPNVNELNKADWQPLLDAFLDADNLGSLITPPPVKIGALMAQLGAFEAGGRQEASMDAPRLKQVLKQADLLGKQYLAVVANPPYMGTSRFNPTIRRFVIANYPRSKSDMFAVFMERLAEFTVQKGCAGMVTMHSWMFLSSYEELRKAILDGYDLQSMVHLGPKAFPEIGGEVVQTTAFTIAKQPPQRTASTFVRLVDYDSSTEKEKAFLGGAERYIRDNQQDFDKIPGSPIAYWVNNKVFEVFAPGNVLYEKTISDSQIITGDNNRFLRLHWEVCNKSVSIETKWRFYAKGGSFRRWRGNLMHIIDWAEETVKYHRSNKVSRMVSEHLWLTEGITWGFIASDLPSFRYLPHDALFDVGGSSIFFEKSEHLTSMLGFFNSSIALYFLRIANPTLNLQIRNIRDLPFIDETLTDTLIIETVQEAERLSQRDWDNFETSWDFQTHPLSRTSDSKLATAFENWQKTADTAFGELKRLEEENNRYWIDAYGLQDELTPEVPDAQITVRRADLVRDVKSLLSYAVGCLMGRYSLSQPGLQFAGGTFERSHFTGDFLPDEDGILPITDEAYFEDDIVTGLESFLKAAYGASDLQANLTFIADALKRKADETPRERIRRYFLDEFVSDHIQTYKKRPIYWLFTSGKEKGFSALVYLHRYTPDTLATMRNDYVLELQGKLAAELDRVARSREGANTRDAKLAERRLKKLRAQQTEVVGFQERLQSLADRRLDLDLDDGVAYNYTRFAGLVYEGSDLKLADLHKKSAWKRELLSQTS